MDVKQHHFNYEKGYLMGQIPSTLISPTCEFNTNCILPCTLPKNIVLSLNIRWYINF